MVLLGLGEAEEACTHAQKLAHLSRLHLKTVIKEAHASPLQQLAFCHTDAMAKTHLFATVGKDHATIYDDRHFGRHVDVVAQFVNERTEFTPGGDVLACCWLSSRHSEEEFGDTLLAVAGRDNSVSIISVVSSAVVALLKGHTKAVVDLAACESRPDLLLSTAKDGTTRVWDWQAEACLAVLAADATVASWAPLADGIVTGHSSGALQRWPLPPSAALAAADVVGSKRRRMSPPAAPDALARKDATVLKKADKDGAHSAAIDCIRWLPNHRAATKSVDGRLFVWDTTTWERVVAIKVPGCPPGCEPSLFGMTPSGDFLVAGNASGDTFVYDAATGTRVVQLKADRIKNSPVRACGITDDCRHVLAVYGQGFIWRYEFIAPPPGAAEPQVEAGQAEQAPPAADQ